MLSTFEQKREFMLWFTCAFVMAFALFMLPIAPALAQNLDASPPVNVVDFSPLANQIIAVAVAVLTVLAGVVSRYGVAWFAAKTKMQDAQMEALLAERVSDILGRSIDYAEMWMKKEVADPDSQIKQVRIDNFFVKEAAKYAMRSMPDLIKYFNLTQERIEELIKSRLNGITVTPVADSREVTTVTGA